MMFAQSTSQLRESAEQIKCISIQTNHLHLKGRNCLLQQILMQIKCNQTNEFTQMQSAAEKIK